MAKQHGMIQRSELTHPSELDGPLPSELDFLSLLTMTVALFGLGAFSVFSLLAIIVG